MSSTSMKIHFFLNGEKVKAEIEPHQSLLEVLRKDFTLYGARESCGQGLCGCCTVMLNGESVSGCLSLAATADGGDVVTIEHLEDAGKLDPVQQAFIECGAFQCGFCTSGFILMSRELLEQNPDPSDAEIRNYLSGNLCRCAAYPEIIDAVKLAAVKRREQTACAG